VSELFDSLIDSLKKAAAALRDADIPFAVAGGFAAWARGGPPTEHDVDFILKAEDTDRALQALGAAGMRTERPPEGWLVKAWDGDNLIDLVFAPSGMVVDDAILARCDETSVEAMRLPVMPLEDVLVTKLLSLDEHHLAFSGLLEMTRAVREQVDWEDVRTRSKSSPYARTFFVLAEELGVLPA
jgi:hypothetical protein